MRGGGCGFSASIGKMETKEGLEKECLLACAEENHGEPECGNAELKKIKELEKRIRELEYENAGLRKQIAVFNEDREHMRQMQAKGIAEAKQKGINFGRPPLKIPDEFTEMEELYRKGEISARAAADTLGVSANTFRKWMKKPEEEKAKKLRRTTGRKSEN